MTLLTGAAVAQSGDAFAPFFHDPARPNVLRLDGDIDLRTPVRFGHALDRYREIDTLELASAGGSAYGALLMVDRIHAAGLDTVIPAGEVCHSACSFLFFAGTDRAAEGELGVHQPSGSNLATGLVAINDVLDVFDRFDVPAEVRRRMLDTPSDDMYVFTPEDLQRLGLLGPATAQDAPPEATPAAAAPDPPLDPAQPVLTVKTDGTGDHRSIAAAVNAAPEGARIEVYPGTYTGEVRVTTSVHIVGLGPRESVVWQAADNDVVTWYAETGSLTGLTIHQTGDDGSEDLEALVILRGAPEIRDCDISSSAGSAVLVIGAMSRPTITQSAIQASRKHGIHIAGGASGSIRENDIHGNTGRGILIESEADPSISDNRIFANRSNGILAQRNGLGTIEGNRIYDNRASGIAITSRAGPVFRRNEVFDGWLSGVFVYLLGEGVLEDNDIYGNAGSGVVVASEANPVFHGNRIHDNRETGFLIRDGGLGTIDGNEIFANAFSGVLIRSRADPDVRNNKIEGTKAAGIRIIEGAFGTIEGNDIAECAVGIMIDAKANPEVRNNSFTACEKTVVRGE